MPKDRYHFMKAWHTVRTWKHNGHTVIFDCGLQYHGRIDEPSMTSRLALTDGDIARSGRPLCDICTTEGACVACGSDNVRTGECLCRPCGDDLQAANEKLHRLA